jgi:hypothetical protein
MAFTYSKLAEVTVGSGGASSIDFNNIPQNYNDLIVKLSGRSNAASLVAQAEIRFNSNASQIYSDKKLRGNGTAASSASGNSNNSIHLILCPAANSTASTFCNVEVYIPNYTSSNSKSVSIDSVGENNATEAYQWLVAGIWPVSTTISSISLLLADFVQYSTATLYGVKAEV